MRVHFYPMPKRIIRQGRATVVLFEDGAKSVVRLQDGDTDDIYVAICIAIAKRFCGSGAEIKKLISKVEYPEAEKCKVKPPKKAKQKKPKYRQPGMPFSAIELFHELFDEMNERSQ